MASGSAKATYREKARARFAVCKECPYFDGKRKLVEICTKCGCLARLKALHPGETCPEGRW